MNNKQAKLVNAGSKCYLNSGIQAISACPRFTEEINKLSIDNLDLMSLKVFNTLLKSINDKTSNCKDISTSKIFQKWNKPGQQDSFELLAHVINEVYDEIRNNLEHKGVIEKKNLNEWIKINLPMRIIMQHNIQCECGYKDRCPLQSEVALHISFPVKSPSKFNSSKNNSSRKESFNKTYISSSILHIEDMIDHHFEKDKIQDFECGHNDCKKKNAFRTLKLHSTLPDTICIHLQRLYWTGGRMEKITDMVLFCNRLVIKYKYLKNENSSEDESDKGMKDLRDVHYYLKSVIVHSGGESSGHYICYKKCNGHWYYTNDTHVKEVNFEEVFRCNPYILFYEKSDFEEICPTIIKMNYNINIIIHAFATCSVFVNWLNEVVVNNASQTIKSLLNLINFANGNVKRNENLQHNSIIERFNDSRFRNNFFDTLKDIFLSLNMELNGESKVPTAINFETTFSCKCSNNPVVTFSEIIQLIYKKSPGLCDIQKLVDLHLGKEQDSSSYCTAKRCKNINITGRIKLKAPLPDMICFYLTKIDKLKLQENFAFNQKIFIKLNMDNDERPFYKEYYLKSVVDETGCFRLANGLWYFINNNNVRMAEVKLLWTGYPCMIFYDINPDKCLQVSSQIPPEDNTSEDITHRTFSVISINDCLNSLIQAMSSCMIFIQKQQCIYKDSLNSSNAHDTELQRSLEHFFYLYDVCTKNHVHDERKNQFIKKEWLNECSKFDVIFKAVLNKILINNHNEKNWEMDPLRCHYVRRVSCSCGYTTWCPEEVYFCLNVSTTKTVSNLQDMIDIIFSNKNIKGKVCDNEHCFKNCGRQRYKLCLPLSKTICIKVLSNPEFTFFDIIIIKKENVVKNNDHNLGHTRDEVYTLKSLITDSGRCCYRKVDDTWYKVTGKSFEKSSENAVFACTPHHLFYESLDLVTCDKPLRGIIHALSSSSSFVKWLKEVSDNNTMTKGKYLYNVIKENNLIEELRDSWNFCYGLDLYQLLHNVVHGIKEELETKSMASEERIPLLLFNFINSSETVSSPSIFIDIHLQNSLGLRNSFQELWDKYFDLYANRNSSIISLHFKQNDIFSKEVFSFLPDTIIFHIPKDVAKLIYLEDPFVLIIKNKLCSHEINCFIYRDCCRKYNLKSIIDQNNINYEIKNNELYLRAESTSPLDASYYNALELQILIYEL